jgi:DNA-binding MarR family transcriptional regulator
VITACVCTNLRMTLRAINRLYDTVLRESGLTTTDYTILSRLASEGPMMVSQLAARLAMDRTTCTREIRPLVDAGLVQTGVGSDRRQRVLSLTRRGRAAYTRAHPLWEGVQARVREVFGPRQTDELLGSLRVLHGVGAEVLNAESRS